MSAIQNRLLLFIFSMVFIIGLLFLTYVNPAPSEQQWFMYLCVLALGGAGFAAFLPGSIEWQLQPGLKATGALAVLLIVFFYGRTVTSHHGVRDWKLVPPQEGVLPSKDATVYVRIDDKVVKADGLAVPWIKVDDASELGKSITVERDAGGITVHIARPKEGSTIQVIVQDEDRWWTSYKRVIPPPFNLELQPVSEKSVRNAVQ